jgi:glycosyltransferase involved in cell wall biosynthesis
MTLVSAVIPCYNQASLLGEAIESVLSQSHRPIETIVVDDGSIDDTAEMARSCDGVRCIRQENRGVAEARNTGLRASTGDVLLFLDADDVLAEDAVEVGLTCLDRDPDAAFVFGRPELVGFAPGLAPPRVDGNYYLRLLESNFIWMPGLVLYRRRALEEVGGFDPHLGGAADYELYLRMVRSFPIAFCPKMTGTYRRHKGSMSNNSARMFRDTSIALRSQREYVAEDPEYREAYRRGRENLKRAYGRWTVVEASQQIGSGRLLAAVSALWILLKYDPRGFLSAIAGGLRQTAATLAGGTPAR